MKTLFNSKKVPVIPTTVVNNKLVTNFKDKANIFILSKQCHSMPNNSTLPSIQSFETSSSEEKIKINTGFEFMDMKVCLSECKKFVDPQQ